MCPEPGLVFFTNNCGEGTIHENEASAKLKITSSHFVVAENKNIWLTPTTAFVCLWQHTLTTQKPYSILREISCN